MLEQVLCRGCGAPVALAATSPVACRHCGAPVVLPPTHVALFSQVTQGEADLAKADALWRTMPRPMPRGFERLFAVAIVAVVAGSIAFWIASGMQLVGGPGFSFAVCVWIPTALALQALLELLAYWSPRGKLELDFSAIRDPGFPEVLLCRHCGAALSVAPDRVAARCVYCRTDNLVAHPKRQARTRAAVLASAGKRQLDEAIKNAEMLVVQRKIIRWVGGIVNGGITLFFLLVLRNR